MKREKWVKNYCHISQVAKDKTHAALHGHCKLKHEIMTGDYFPLRKTYFEGNLAL